MRFVRGRGGGERVLMVGGGRGTCSIPRKANGIRSTFFLLLFITRQALGAEFCNTDSKKTMNERYSLRIYAVSAEYKK